MTPTFSEPTPADYTQLAKRWIAVGTLAKDEFGVEIDQSLAALDVLQRILDNDLVSDEGVLAVGVVMGRIMAKNIPGLDWWVAIDDFGRDLCLRYRTTTLQVSPTSMVWKRVHRKEIPNLQHLFDVTKAEVERLASVAD